MTKQRTCCPVGTARRPGGHIGLEAGAELEAALDVPDAAEGREFRGAIRASLYKRAGALT
jgi:hypothetical protein